MSLRRPKGRRVSLFPGRTPSPTASKDETAAPTTASDAKSSAAGDAPSESDSSAEPSAIEPTAPPGPVVTELDDVTQKSLPAFGEDGKPLDTDDFPAPKVDEAKIAGGLKLPSDGAKGPSLSVEGAYDIPPESVSEFVQLIEEEEAAEEYASRGEAHLSEPPASGVEDYLKEGYFQAVQAKQGDDEREPSSLAAMFEEMGGQERSWWADDEDAYTSETDELIRASTPPFAPAPKESKDAQGKKGDRKKPPARDRKKPPARKTPPVRKKLASVPPPLPKQDTEAGDEAAKALFRASGRQAARADDDIDLARPTEAAATEPGPRSSKRSASPAEPSRSSRWQIYALGLLVAGAVGWYFEQRSRAPEGPAAPPATVIRTVVIERPGLVPGADGGSPAEAATSNVDAGSPGPGFGQPQGWPAWADAGGTIPTTPDAGGGEDPTTSAEPDGGSVDPAASASPTAEATAQPAAAEFDRAAARQALQSAAGAASACPRGTDEGSRTATVAVTFAPSGRVTTALLTGGPFAGTQTGSCIARAFKGARVPPFEGSFVTVHKTVRLQ